MPGRIAVEEGLTPFRQALQENGWDVVELREGMDMSGVLACVVSGGDSNMMGMQDIKSDIPVINAEGRTAEEVVSRLRDMAH